MIRVGVLGASGSIGTQTLDVVRRYPDRFVVSLIAVGSRRDRLNALGEEFGCQRLISAVENPQALHNPDLYDECDVVVNGIGGIGGIQPSRAVLESGAQLATANKECLVACGDYLMTLARSKHKTIIPIDSEHSTIARCLEGGTVKRLLLTASGGAFRSKTKEEIAVAKAEAALLHPNWKMGEKITIDCATMANKGMELIEAKHLFGLPAEAIDVVVHPESIVHSLVEFTDGTMKAALSYPDMAIPIQYALTAPQTLTTDVKPLDLAAIGSLRFEKPDELRFPCLTIAKEVNKAGGNTGAVFAIADEIAVALYRSGTIGFYGINAVIQEALDRFADRRTTVEPAGIAGMEEEVREYTLSTTVRRFTI